MLHTADPPLGAAPETVFVPPAEEDLSGISLILDHWLDADEALTYRQRIKTSLTQDLEFNMRFWVMKSALAVIGVGGLADPLPSILEYARTERPGELKILYLAPAARGQGFGGHFLAFLETEAVRRGRTELLVRSAERYRQTAFGFYKACGYEDLGPIINTAGKPMELFRKRLDTDTAAG